MAEGRMAEGRMAEGRMAEGRMAAECWSRANGMASNCVFDAILLIPLQVLPRACPPQLRCHQPPVICHLPCRNGFFPQHCFRGINLVNGNLPTVRE
jgi:hypothetical protein